MIKYPDKTVAFRIAAAMYADSHIPITDSLVLKLSEAMEADKQWPTEDEIDELVTGGDGGRPSKKLIQKFPNLNKAIEESYA